jgi:hypothetical protein
LLTTVTCWPGLTDAGTVYVKSEMTIWLPAGAATFELDVDGDGAAGTEDGPVLLSGADDGDAWFPPPHAPSRLTEIMTDEIKIPVFIMRLS